MRLPDKNWRHALRLKLRVIGYWPSHFPARIAALIPVVVPFPFIDRVPDNLILKILEMSLPSGDLQWHHRLELLRAYCLFSHTTRSWARPLLSYCVRLDTGIRSEAFADAVKSHPRLGEDLRELGVHVRMDWLWHIEGFNMLAPSLRDILGACTALRVLSVRMATELDLGLLAECQGLETLSLSASTVSTSPLATFPSLLHLTLISIKFPSPTSTTPFHPSSFPSLLALSTYGCFSELASSPLLPLPLAFFLPLLPQIQILSISKHQAMNPRSRISLAPFSALKVLCLPSAAGVQLSEVPTSLRAIRFDAQFEGEGMTVALLKSLAGLVAEAIEDGTPSVAKLERVMLPRSERGEGMMRGEVGRLEGVCRERGIRWMEEEWREDEMERARFWGLDHLAVAPACLSN